MEVVYEKAFYKDLSKLTDPNIVKRLLTLIELIKTSEDISKLPSIKKLIGFSDYYRIRIGDYRVGLKYNSNRVHLIRFLHSKDIYRIFP